MDDLTKQQFEEALWRDAVEIAKQQKQKTAVFEAQERDLESQISELRSRLAGVQRQRHAANLAPQRLSSYVPISGGAMPLPPMPHRRRKHRQNE